MDVDEYLKMTDNCFCELTGIDFIGRNMTKLCHLFHSYIPFHNKEYKNPMHNNKEYIVFNNNFEQFKSLSIRDKYNLLKICISLNRLEMVKEIDFIDIHLCIQHRNYDILKYMVSKSTLDDLYIRNEDGKIPIEVCIDLLNENESNINKKMIMLLIHTIDINSEYIFTNQSIWFIDTLIPLIIDKNSINILLNKIEHKYILNDYLRYFKQLLLINGGTINKNRSALYLSIINKDIENIKKYKVDLDKNSYELEYIFANDIDDIFINMDVEYDKKLIELLLKYNSTKCIIHTFDNIVLHNYSINYWKHVIQNDNVNLAIYLLEHEYFEGFPGQWLSSDIIKELDITIDNILLDIIKKGKHKLLYFFLTKLDNSYLHIDYTDNNNNNLLHVLLLSGNTNIICVKILVKLKPSIVNEKNNEHKTPLFYTTDMNILDYLINNGAKIDTYDNIGWSPIHYISKFATPNIFLLFSNKNIKTRYEGYTPLLVASIYNNKEGIKYLCNNDNIYDIDIYGNTIFHYLAYNGNYIDDIFNNKNYNIENNFGLTPAECLDIAVNAKIENTDYNNLRRYEEFKNNMSSNISRIRKPFNYDNIHKMMETIRYHISIIDNIRI